MSKQREQSGEEAKGHSGVLELVGRPELESRLFQETEQLSTLRAPSNGTRKTRFDLRERRVIRTLQPTNKLSSLKRTRSEYRAVVEHQRTGVCKCRVR
jgi:hypothetical protein